MKKRALVTGSTQGIGLAIANQLAAAGHLVAIHGIESESVGNDIATAISVEFGTEVVYVRADLSNSDETLELVEKVEAALNGPLDILVNNAGIQNVASIGEFTLAKWSRLLDVNLTAPFILMKDVLEGMRERGWGRILNIASVHGLVGSVNKSAYLASKHGLVGLSKGIALEFATAGVTVNCICPGFTDTAILEPQIRARAEAVGGSREDGVKELLKEKQPNLKLLDPAHIGAAVVYLASDAGSGITGIQLPIDGGWTAQ
ncbi:3-hydroxybutyrate dehydrogenase [Pseudorhodoferax sp. Leaf265]|uniref:3-hydroxybutyrate dehydrogenase n=1 Tax=Pseudorhodoferax sp. Leaf265 TaxID=1736315 RepID=UPI0006F42A43|nr:3-hydroxybutyrate dehydrogenase [Pseudorhodoferax sp. Leaf265]KQP12367.1 3-hydroxybutyrate dehydrogenase [Pseudorhodoferax sp. Leaf265]